MKSVLLLTALITFSLNSFAQDWGDWIDMGHEIQVSFKFSQKGCDGYSYARIRNVSDKNTYCRIRIIFSKVCNNISSNEAAVSAYKLGPGQISESKGDWYNTEKVSNLILTHLENMECKDVLNIKPTTGRVTEIVFEKKTTPEHEYRRKLDSLKIVEEQKDKERKEKLELKKKENEAQAKRDQQKYENEEKIAKQKTERLANSTVVSYPNTEEGRLRAKIDADAKKKSENLQALNSAIPSLVENTYGIIQGIESAKKERQKKAEAYYSEQRKEIANLVKANEDHDKYREKVKLQYQRQLITKESRQRYFLYKSYTDYYMTVSREDSSKIKLNYVIGVFFSDTSNFKIKPAEFVNLLNMFTWKNGYLLEYFLSQSFRNYIQEIKGEVFAQETIENLKQLKNDADQIASQQFGAFFLPAMFYPSVGSGHELFKKFKYSEAITLQFDLVESKTLPQLQQGKQILSIEFSAHKDSKRKKIFPYNDGTLSISVKKINSSHIININSSFVFSMDSDLENNIELAQLSSDDPTKGPPQLYSIDNRSHEISKNYSTTLIKYNTEVNYETSFGISEIINADIYFMLSHNFIPKYGTDNETDIFLGHIVDKMNSSALKNYEIIKGIFNYPMGDHEKYELTGPLRTFINRNFDYGNTFYSLEGLSLLLITDVERHKLDNYGVNKRKLYRWYTRPYEK